MKFKKIENRFFETIKITLLLIMDINSMTKIVNKLNKIDKTTPLGMEQLYQFIRLIQEYQSKTDNPNLRNYLEPFSVEFQCWRSSGNTHQKLGDRVLYLVQNAINAGFTNELNEIFGVGKNKNGGHKTIDPAKISKLIDNLNKIDLTNRKQPDIQNWLQNCLNMSWTMEGQYRSQDENISRALNFLSNYAITPFKSGSFIMEEMRGENIQLGNYILKQCPNVFNDAKIVEIIYPLLNIKLPKIEKPITKKPVESEVKPKLRKSIPKTVRDNLWIKYFGKDSANGSCQCCGKSIHFTEWDAGHVVAVSNGGDNSIENLKPVCRACNLSMGSDNMEEFKKQHFPKQQ